MEDSRSLLQKQQMREAEARRAADALQEAKLKALQDALGNYGDLSYVDFDDFIDPDNQNWADYTYRLPSFMVSPTESAKRYGRINAGTPVGMFIENIRDTKTTDDVKKQLEIWNSYKPLDSSDNGKSYVRYFMPGFGAYRNTPSIGSRPIQTIAGGTGGGTQGVQAGAQTGNGVARGGAQGSNNGSGGTQGMKAGGTGGTSGMRTGNTGGTYASSGVPRGGTKTIGYDPNPGNISLAYVMRNAPEQERRTALINKWNRENGRESVPYVPGTEIPAGSLNRSGSTYATPGMSTGGTYSTGGGIKDANGNVLTNPGGDWEYQYALKNPQYGLGMMGKMSDAQRNYLQAVSDDMGYNYNFTGATRFV